MSGIITVIKKAIIFLVLVALVGGGLVFGADYWINSKDEEVVAVAPAAPQIKLKTVVVASVPLSFGTVLSSENLDAVSWPENAMPPGVFVTIEELLKDGERVALRPIEPYEPILASKITGSNDKASLSRVITKGHRAVTIRVNDVAGVAGFILPGDRVDVVLTRQIRITGDPDIQSSRDRDTTIANLLLQGVKVLTIDQIADERSDQPQVAKAVTLELTASDAQKVALASSVGDLSLLLRSAGDNSFDLAQTISLADLGAALPKKEDGKIVPVVADSFLQIKVRRPNATKEYEVPIITITN